MSSEFVLGYITGATQEELKKIARILLEEKLIACANVFPQISSSYWWEGKIEESNEAAMLIKSKKKLTSKIITRVKELHSYDCPCVVFFKIKAGNSDFLHWINKEVRED